MPEPYKGLNAALARSSGPSAEDVERAQRITEGRAKHGVGASEDFPGNVCHLVSPIVGVLRLRERDGEGFRARDMEWFIDRLSLVLDMAEREAADRAAHTAAAEARGAERGARAVVEAVEQTGSCGGLTADADGCYVRDALATAREAAARVGGA